MTLSKFVGSSFPQNLYSQHRFFASFCMHHSKRKASDRIDYSRLNSLGFDSEEEDGKEATCGMDPSVDDVYDSENEVVDVRLQNPE